MAARDAAQVRVREEAAADGLELADDDLAVAAPVVPEHPPHGAIPLPQAMVAVHALPQGMHLFGLGPGMAAGAGRPAPHVVARGILQPLEMDRHRERLIEAAREQARQQARQAQVHQARAQARALLAAVPAPPAPPRR